MRRCCHGLLGIGNLSPAADPDSRYTTRSTQSQTFVSYHPSSQIYQDFYKSSSLINVLTHNLVTRKHPRRFGEYLLRSKIAIVNRVSKMLLRVDILLFSCGWTPLDISLGLHQYRHPADCSAAVSVLQFLELLQCESPG